MARVSLGTLHAHARGRGEHPAGPIEVTRDDVARDGGPRDETAERFVPRDRRVAAGTRAAERLRDAIGIEAHVVEHGGFRAGLTAAERVCAIAVDAENALRAALVPAESRNAKSLEPFGAGGAR